MRWHRVFWFAGLGLLLVGLTAQRGLRLFSGETPAFYKGVTLGLFEIGPIPKSLESELRTIRDSGANSISLPVYWFQANVFATRIQPYTGAGFTQAQYDAQIRATIEEAHALGLSVFLLPIVQLEQVEKGQWRGTLQPTDWARWFASYRTFILHYARLAAVSGVELFSVGSELASTEGFRQEWVDLIGQVRTVYPGQMTYSANWDHYREVRFWDQLDYLGLSGYYQLTAAVPATYPALRRTWRSLQSALLEWQQSQGKPMIFTEIGYPSRSGAARNPWDYTASGALDLHLQRLCFKAFIETWKETPQLAGTYLWLWVPGKGGPTDRGYAWRGKPAQAEIEAWFQSL